MGGGVFVIGLGGERQIKAKGLNFTWIVATSTTGKHTFDNGYFGHSKMILKTISWKIKIFHDDS